MTGSAVLAVAATAVTVVAVGVVAVVTPSDGHDAPTATVSISTVVGDSPTDSGSQDADTGAATTTSDGGGHPSSTGSSPSRGPAVAGGFSSPSKAPAQPARTPPSAPPSSTATTAAAPPTSRNPPPAAGLDDPGKKEIAMELVSSAENSSLDWRAQYRYIQDIHDGRGYTGGIIGFCSGTGDMLQVVQRYAALEPGNVLARYLGALKADDGSATHSGLDPTFTKDWAAAATDPKFQQAQDAERDAEYFTPAVDQAKADGLSTLGQFVYYDAMVMHGPGSDPQSFGGIRAAALHKAKPPSQGGDQRAYLNAFLDARIVAMKADPSHQDTSRIDTEQRVFVEAGNFDLDIPLRWSVYGDPYAIG